MPIRSLENKLSSNAWPFLEAKKLYEYIGKKTPQKGYVLFETGYGPSGLPHIGTFAEVMRTTLVRQAFMQICDIPTKLICFSDDLDGFRKVPTNLPNNEMLQEHIGKPLTSVPDPYGECESFGDYMNAKLRSFLDEYGFEYDFYSAKKCYESGLFDEMLLKVIQEYDKIMDIMLPTLGPERRATYSPFMPICKKSGKVLQVKIEEIDKSNATIKYKDEDGELIETAVTGGKCKLQWKPDFGGRWSALDVDYEMYGKEHMPNSKIYTQICQTLGGKAPLQFFYELFLDKNGEKISKSKGNSISVDDCLKYAPKESILLFMYNSPSKAKKLFFEVLPKSIDEYLTFIEKYHNETDEVKQLSNPVYHIHNGDVPKINNYKITYSLLLNLASVCNPDNKSILWGFISKYAPEATPDTSPYLDKMASSAINYYNDFVKNSKEFILPSAKEKEVLDKVIEYLKSIDDNITAEELQSAIYNIGMNANYENLRDFFKMIYQVLLGQQEGPRLGSFFKLYGIKDTIKLIESKIK